MFFFQAEDGKRDRDLLGVQTCALPINEAKLSDYRKTIESIESDLNKNKIARKLKVLGADLDIDIARDKCPSCHQTIDDSLIMAETVFQPMSLDQNIAFSESQKKMVDRYIAGITELIKKQKNQLKTIDEEIIDKKLYVLSLKRDVRGFSSVSEADIRVKLSLEDKLSKAIFAADKVRAIAKNMEDICLRYTECRQRIASIPKTDLSYNDKERLSDMQGFFRELASDFGYRSAPVQEININDETYFPYLAGLELREINSDVEVDIRTDIKSDSSASDYVRLIWAYLISILLVSQKRSGNHPGLLLFDEPAQHSMGMSSVNKLLKALNSQKIGQSIIAASFDESDDMFDSCTDGVNYHLVRLGDKLFEKNSLV